MKLTQVVRMSILISIFSGGAPLYAQDQHEDAKPPQEEARPEANPKHEEAKPARKQDEAKPTKQDEVKPRQEESNFPRGEDKRGQDAMKPSKEGGHQVQSKQGQQGGHIPDDKFRGHFGRPHTFVVNQPTVVEGQPRFQYGGYWFTIVDPWPEGWAYTDDCYIDYIDGEYFLFDLLHPGVRIALFVVL